MSVYMELRCVRCDYTTKADTDGLGPGRMNKHLETHPSHEYILWSEYDDMMGWCSEE